LGQLDDEILDSKDFPWLLTMNEMLETVIVHCERAQNAQDSLMLHANLKQACNAMKAALNVYGMRLKKENVE
jgi:hypothetical protein